MTLRIEHVTNIPVISLQGTYADMKYPFITPKYYYSLFIDIVNFIKKPINAIDSEKPTKFKIYDTIGLFIVKLLFLIPVALLINLIHDPENLTKVSMSERFLPIMLFVVAGIILPTVEEVCFRLSLRFKPIYLAISSSVFVYYMANNVIAIGLSFLPFAD